MFLYFKRREKRGKREAPRPRFLVLRRKTLTVGAALLAAAAIFGAVNAPAAVRASVATRQLPIYCVERDQKVCSISFDAAWGADNTQKILDVLADYGVKATFFVVGNWADQYPERAKAIVDSGCELMNHSNAHDHYNSLTAEQIIKDVNTCNDTRQALKSEGFKWAPSQGAWQRQLNQNAIRAAARLDFLRPEDGKSPYQLQPFAKRAEKDVSR